MSLGFPPALSQKSDRCPGLFSNYPEMEEVPNKTEDLEVHDNGMLCKAASNPHGHVPALRPSSNRERPCRRTLRTPGGSKFPTSEESSHRETTCRICRQSSPLFGGSKFPTTEKTCNRETASRICHRTSRCPGVCNPRRQITFLTEKQTPCRTCRRS